MRIMISQAAKKAADNAFLTIFVMLLGAMILVGVIALSVRELSRDDCKELKTAYNTGLAQNTAGMTLAELAGHYASIQRTLSVSIALRCDLTEYVDSLVIKPPAR